MDRSFMAAGRCAGLDPGLFHPERGDMKGIAEAKAVCAGCPVREACLTYALDAGEHWDIWGGVTAEGRRRLRKQRLAA
jgi:WhiB family redox-sensing transcriptional regulator